MSVVSHQLLLLVIAVQLMLVTVVTAQENSPGLERYDGALCTEYGGTVRQLQTDVWIISNNYSSCSERTAKGLRVWTSANSTVNASQPLVFVIRDDANVQTWKLPFTSLQSNFYEYSQTVCSTLHNDQSVAMYIDVFTIATENVSYELKVEPVTGFELMLNDPIDVSIGANSPEMYYFQFPENISNIQVSVSAADSNSSNCAIVSIQNATCPVNTLVDTSRNGVIYQTIDHSSTILVQKSAFSEFFVVIEAAHPSDCKRDADDSLDNEHSQNFRLIIEEAKLATDYPFAISFPVIIFVLVGAAVTIFFTITCVSTCSVRFVPLACCQPIIHKCFSEEREKQPLVPSHEGINTSGNERVLLDKKEHKLRLTDITKSPLDNLRKDYNGYIWNTITVAIFYGLPAFQLVLAKQLILNADGNEDTCYYNFKCAKRYHVLSAFNNNWSNIGYLLLGVTFVIIVGIRNYIAWRDKLNSKEFGLPQFFGVYYAMGFGMIAEGFMSAFYHICPSHFDFQFDTAFMFILSGLLIVRIIQARHPGLYSNAFVALLCLAVIVLLTFIGIYEESKENARITLSTKLVLFFFFLVIIGFFCISYYFYLGCHAHLWLNKAIYRWFKNWCYPKCSYKPRHWMRFIKVLILIVANFAVGMFSLFQVSTDIATIVLYLFLTNLLLLIIFYVISKLLFLEPWTLTPIVFLVITVVLWGFSLYFFTSNVSQWEYTPAASRDLNHQCVIFGFYDNHDIWHILSAFAMFFAFLFLLTMDDGLAKVPRKDIHIF